MKARSYGGFGGTNTESVIFSDVVSCWTSSRQGKPKQSCQSQTEQESLLVELERPWLACPHCQQAMHCIVATGAQLVGHHEQHSPSALVSNGSDEHSPSRTSRLDDAQSCPVPATPANRSQSHPSASSQSMKTDLESSTRHKLKSFRSSGNLSLRQFYA